MPRAGARSWIPVLADAWLVAAKDLRIERKSRVVFGQVLPFGVLMLILFGFGLSPDLQVAGLDRSVLQQSTAGLFWLTTLLVALLALGRGFAIESEDGNLDALKLAGLDPGGIFLGKALAVAAQLVIVECALGTGALLLYDAPLSSPGLLLATVAAATLAIASAGVLQAGFGSGTPVRDTLVPILVLPVLAPVLLGATIATEAALFGPASDGWGWTTLLAVFAALYTVAGTLAFGLLIDDA